MSVSATTGAATTSAVATNALSTLSGNFNDFLSLLTTQLKNQDPTSPLDTSQFTSELVQFTGVEQQITTNASLTSLIQATQGAEVIQGTAIVGKTVSVTSPSLVLQNGAASIGYTAPAAEPVAFTVTNSAGAVVKTATATSASGVNSWSWNGQSDANVQEPDGVYTVTVTGMSAGGTSSALPFTVNGTATGVTNTNGAVTLNIGALAVDFSAIVAVGK